MGTYHENDYDDMCDDTCANRNQNNGVKAISIQVEKKREINESNHVER
jgi:hypothetical protein